MLCKTHNRASRRNAVAAVKVAVALPILLGCVALAVDMGVVYNTRAELQRTADAAALAAIAEVAYATTPEEALPEATLVAADYVDRNDVFGKSMTVDPNSDVIFGHSYYDVEANRYNFVPEDAPTNSVRVTVRQTADSANGATQLFFASFFGKGASNVSASAVAIFVGSNFTEADCYDDVPPGSVMMCHVAGDSDDSDDSEAGDSDDSDDSDSDDSDGSTSGDSDDSDDSASGDSDDSDDSQGDDSGSGDSDYGDSESAADPTDSDSPHTIIVDAAATPLFLNEGDTLGWCVCAPGDSDDSDDSEFGDSGDSDDSDSGDSDGSFEGDSDDSDDSEFGDSDDSDDSHADGRDNIDDSDLDESDDSDSDGGVTVAGANVTLCHYPPGNPGNSRTITVGEAAVAAHIAEHGDTIGLCPQDVKIFLIE